ncbi:hypothetical protein SDC9_132269 [bioreactor metagenome]|uniref:Uncharacterized protein n=1 Tax=bioreactor metagenome TaxID=1076179 RepID=A0A645D7G7_9ZZZZ
MAINKAWAYDLAVGIHNGFNACGVQILFVTNTRNQAVTYHYGISGHDAFHDIAANNFVDVLDNQIVHDFLLFLMVGFWFFDMDT